MYRRFTKEIAADYCVFDIAKVSFDEFILTNLLCRRDG